MRIKIKKSEKRPFLQQYFVIPQESSTTPLSRKLKFVGNSYGMTKVGLNMADKKCILIVMKKVGSNIANKKQNVSTRFWRASISSTVFCHSAGI